MTFDIIVLFIGPLISKITADSNAGALDPGLDAALAFVDLAPTGCVGSYVLSEKVRYSYLYWYFFVFAMFKSDLFRRISLCFDQLY